MPTNLEMFSMVTRQTVAQQKETWYKISEQQVYKYLVLLYNCTKCGTNNTQKSTNITRCLDRWLFCIVKNPFNWSAMCEKPV